MEDLKGECEEPYWVRFPYQKLATVILIEKDETQFQLSHPPKDCMAFIVFKSYAKSAVEKGVENEA
ncbi:hypothetical protein JW711_03355 [Candidatus Woesearchaeota archaeon]|nr:hypothetical protein [Candidatus Woesearchaeota archaeon]